MVPSSLVQGTDLFWWRPSWLRHWWMSDTSAKSIIYVMQLDNCTALPMGSKIPSRPTEWSVYNLQHKIQHAFASTAMIIGYKMIQSLKIQLQDLIPCNSDTIIYTRARWKLQPCRKCSLLFLLMPLEFTPSYWRASTTENPTHIGLEHGRQDAPWVPILQTLKSMSNCTHADGLTDVNRTIQICKVTHMIECLQDRALILESKLILNVFKLEINKKREACKWDTPIHHHHPHPKSVCQS